MRKANLKQVYTQKKISDRDIGATVHSLSRYSRQNIDTRDEVLVWYFLGAGKSSLFIASIAGSVSAFMNWFKLLGAAERALVMLVLICNASRREWVCRDRLRHNGVAVCNKFRSRKKYE